MLLRTFAAGLWICILALGQNQPLPKRYQIQEGQNDATTEPLRQTPRVLKGPDKKRYSFTIQGDQQWTDTGIDVLSGTRLMVTATGSMQYPQASQAAGPDGLSRGWKDLLRVLPVNDSGRGALLARVGAGDISGPFVVGSKREIRSTMPGRLYFGLNQGSNDTADGSYHVSVDVLEVGSASAPVLTDFAADTSKTIDIPGLDSVFRRVPRRVSDPQGNLGDMVNFLILGTEEQVRSVYSAAGWVVVDRTQRDAVLHGLIATLSKQSYVELPMSILYLFGRAQDFGYAHAEPFAVVASRHHLRLWKAPFDLNGKTLWVGAATHDIGFDRDQRNNGVTHKIDPEIDGERKFVAQSLSATGLVQSIGYATPPDPLREARTATGESFHSDGKVLVLVLSSASTQQSQ